MRGLISSIVIPVFNKWELTRSCLKSLAATIHLESTEVIVVDNASTDSTASGCSFLGGSLFGNNFKYVRNEQNRNFAGASNQGAEIASGEFVIFLNNDTVAEAGWQEPMFDDFAKFPKLGATGPLLVYPQTGSMGRPVQHLGVLINPFYRFGHLYQGISEHSALAKKRRFFQAITGACMMLPKALFMQAGKFDEGYINGFEDMDLCGRLGALDYIFTVNPSSVVIHYESQTPGRGKFDDKNYQRLMEGSLRLFTPDWESHLNADGLELEITEWQDFQGTLPNDKQAIYDARLPGLERNELLQLLMDNIYWREGWERLIDAEEDRARRNEWLDLFLKFIPDPEAALKAYELGMDVQDDTLAKRIERIINIHESPPQDMLEVAWFGKKWCQKRGMDKLALQYGRWIDNYGYFCAETYPRFMDKLRELRKREGRN